MKTPELQTQNSTETKEEPKKYLYHMVPGDMVGSTLHPLNDLREINPDLYLSKAMKYSKRPEVMKQFIPTLECLWNDVLHFSAIDPVELKKVLVEAGREATEMKFYQVDPDLLDPEKTTICLFRREFQNDRMNTKNFSDYDTSKIKEHSELPEDVKEYYKKMYEQGEKPLLFLGIPHILHKGPLDISELPVITV